MLTAAHNGRTLAAATVGAGAPMITFTSTPPSTTTDTTATVAWTSAGAGRTFCRIDGGGLRACTSPQRLTGLSVGSHWVKVRVDNGSGYATAIAAWDVVQSTGATPPPPPPPVDGTPPPPPPAPPSTVPTVTVSAPVGGLSGLSTLTASAASATGRILWVDFLVDGRVVGSDNMAPYVYAVDATRLSGGLHDVQAMAWDEGFAPARLPQSPSPARAPRATTRPSRPSARCSPP